MKKIAVIGIGNPELGDDAAGVVLVEALRECMVERENRIELLVMESFSLPEACMLEEYDEIILVDAMDDVKEGEAELYEVYPQEGGVSLTRDLLALNLHAMDPASSAAIALRAGILKGRVYMLGLGAHNIHVGRGLSSEAVNSVMKGITKLLEHLNKTGLTLRVDMDCVRLKILKEVK